MSFLSGLIGIIIPVYIVNRNQHDDINKKTEEHVKWVREIFIDNSPTLQLIKDKKQYINRYISSYSPYNISAYGNGNIGIYKATSGSSPILNDLYGIYKKQAIESGCNEVYNMMKLLNKSQGWNLKIVNKCEVASNFDNYSRVDVVFKK